MRRQKSIFDFKSGISVKFPVEWYVYIYDSFWIYLRSPVKSILRRREVIKNSGNVGKFKMNHKCIHIIRREIWRWFRIWSRKLIFAYAFLRKTRFKKLRGRIQKNFIFLISRLNFDSKYTHMSGNPKSHAVESLMF